ncbi:YsnF/AvaK domain-containing protein [Deinococcus lacus]|uniref:YsnF/AvaK domain-containing protein n=1 Tax=Deinococcus lacus TaxID=392561 RepID=A0ABW1YCV6_9DEIO
MTDNERKLTGRHGEELTAGSERTLVSQGSDTVMVDRLVLHEERAQVQVLREAAGAVTLQKRVVERQEQIPVTIRSEVLEITVKPGAGRVVLDGQELEAGQTYQVELTTERAAVQKEVVAISEVSIGKRAETVAHTEMVTLRREVLDVKDPGALIANAAEVDDLTR